MSFQTRRELLARFAPQYREADRKQKTIILNEFIASTDYKRKYAIRLLSLPEITPAKTIKSISVYHWYSNSVYHFHLGLAIMVRTFKKLYLQPGLLQTILHLKGWFHFLRNWFLHWNVVRI